MPLDLVLKRLRRVRDSFAQTNAAQKKRVADRAPRFPSTYAKGAKVFDPISREEADVVDTYRVRKPVDTSGGRGG